MAEPESRAPLTERVRAGADFIRHRIQIEGDQSPSRERLLPSGGSPIVQQAAAAAGYSSGVGGPSTMGPNSAARDEEGPADFAELNRQPDKLWGSLLGDVAGPLVSWVPCMHPELGRPSASLHAQAVVLLASDAWTCSCNSLSAACTGGRALVGAPPMAACGCPGHRHAGGGEPPAAPGCTAARRAQPGAFGLRTLPQLAQANGTVHLVCVHSWRRL